MLKVRKYKQIWDKDLSQQVEYMQVQMGRDQKSGGASVPCTHAISVGNVKIR